MRGSFSNLLFGQTLQTLPGCARQSCAQMRYAGASEGLIASPEGNFSRGKNRKGEGGVVPKDERRLSSPIYVKT